MSYLENNRVMNYSDIFNFFIIILFIILILTTFIKMPLHITVKSKVVNKDIKIDLNLRYLFNIININIPIYATREKELKKSKIKIKNIKKSKKRKISIKDFLQIYKLLEEIEIEEFYSDIYIGNTNIAITNFTYVFVNLTYANLINIIKPNKFYMNIKPNFIENKLYIDFKIHLKLNIKNIIYIIKFIFTVSKNSKKRKEEDKKYESNRINTKYHGNNS